MIGLDVLNALLLFLGASFQIGDAYYDMGRSLLIFDLCWTLSECVIQLRDTILALLLFRFEHCASSRFVYPALLFLLRKCPAWIKLPHFGFRCLRQLEWTDEFRRNNLALCFRFGLLLLQILFRRASVLLLAAYFLYYFGMILLFFLLFFLFLPFCCFLSPPQHAVYVQSRHCAWSHLSR